MQTPKSKYDLRIAVEQLGQYLILVLLGAMLWDRRAFYLDTCIFAALALTLLGLGWTLLQMRSKCLFRAVREVRFPTCVDIAIRLDEPADRLVDFRVYFSCSPRLLNGRITLLKNDSTLLEILVPRISDYVDWFKIPAFLPWIGGKAIRGRRRTRFYAPLSGNPIERKILMPGGLQTLSCCLELQETLDPDLDPRITAWASNAQAIEIVVAHHNAKRSFSEGLMRYISAIISFLFVFVIVFLLAGWFLMPHLPPVPDHPVTVFEAEYWEDNWIGYLLGVLLGALSARSRYSATAVQNN